MKRLSLHVALFSLLLSAPLFAQNAGQVTLTVSHGEVMAGNSVEIRLHNGTNATIHGFNHPLFRIERQGQPSAGHAPRGGQGLDYPITPGATEVWTLSTDDINPANPTATAMGKYTVLASYSETSFRTQPTDLTTLKATIFVTDPVAEGTSLSLKRPFIEVGEPMQLTLSNDRGWKTGAENTVTIHRGKTRISSGDFITEELAAGESTLISFYPKTSAGKNLPAGSYWLEYMGMRGGEVFIHVLDFEIVSKSQAGLVVNTTKKSYATGEDVKFYILNRFLRTDVIIPNEAPYTIQKNKAPYETIFEPVALRMMTRPLPPGERRMWSWDQVLRDGSIAATGRYRVRLTAGTKRAPGTIHLLRFSTR